MSTKYGKYNKSAAAARPERIIRDVTEVAAHLEEVRDAALASGVQSPWWQGILSIAWGAPRDGANNTQWLDLKYTDRAGISAQLCVRVLNELHVGQIMPTTAEEVAAVAAKSKGRGGAEVRTKKPSLQFQKWGAPVKTEKDGVTLLTDASGNPVLPGDEDLSPYYAVASLVNEAFTAEAEERVAFGARLLALAQQAKKANKDANAMSLLETFKAEIGRPVLRAGDVLMTDADCQKIRGLYKDFATLERGVGLVTVRSSKIAQLCQTNISGTAQKNANLPLPNPMSRVAMNFDQQTGATKGIVFFDKSKPYVVEKKTRYEVATADGEPICNANVHKFIQSGCRVDGVIIMDSVCFSSLGISVPAKAESLVVTPPAARGSTQDDIYNGVDQAAGPADNTGVAPMAIAPSATLDAGDLDALVGELEV